MATVINPPEQLADPFVDSEVLYEVVDGEIVELEPMGAYENILASLLQIRLGSYVMDRDMGHVVQETLFDLEAVNRKRRPDVAFVSNDRWKPEWGNPKTPAWKVVPDLAIEVISPTDLMTEVVAKVGEYFTAGVRNVWLVIPSVCQIYAYDAVNSIRVISRDGELTGEPVVPGFRLSLTELFDEPEEATEQETPAE